MHDHSCSKNKTTIQKESTNPFTKECNPVRRVSLRCLPSSTILCFIPVIPLNKDKNSVFRCIEANIFQNFSCYFERRLHYNVWKKKENSNIRKHKKKFSKLQVRIELTTLQVLGSEFKYKFTRILGLLGLAQNSAVFYIYLKSPYSMLSFVLLLDGSLYFIFFKSYNLACLFFSLIAILLSMFCSVFSWNLSTLQAPFCVTLWRY